MSEAENAVVEVLGAQSSCMQSPAIGMRMFFEEWLRSAGGCCVLARVGKSRSQTNAWNERAGRQRPVSSFARFTRLCCGSRFLVHLYPSLQLGMDSTRGSLLTRLTMSLLQH